MSIIQNKKAYHEYFIEDKYEAGIMLEGWEVKAIRAGRAQLKEAYVTVKNGELYLFGSHISPLLNASTHVHPDPVRTRKLLLHKTEIDKINGKEQPPARLFLFWPPCPLPRASHNQKEPLP